MGGGLPKGQVTLLYGVSSTGKTSLALQCAVVCARRKLKTIFIDSDNTFPVNRLAQIASDDLDHVSPLIFVSRPRTFYEQSLLIENLSYYVKDVALVVLDSITSLYRLELELVDTTFILNRRLNWQTAHLVQAAKAHDLAVIVIGQVRSVITEKGDKRMEPVATRVLKFWAQNILRLRPSEKPALRQALVEKHFEVNHTGELCLFALDEKGIVDLKELGK